MKPSDADSRDRVPCLGRDPRLVAIPVRDDRGSGIPYPAIQAATAEPSSLAAATAQVHQQQPGLLGQLFAPGGQLSSPIAKMALMGTTAMAAQRLMGG